MRCKIRRILASWGLMILGVASAMITVLTLAELKERGDTVLEETGVRSFAMMVLGPIGSLIAGIRMLYVRTRDARRWSA